MSLVENLDNSNSNSNSNSSGITETFIQNQINNIKSNSVQDSSSSSPASTTSMPSAPELHTPHTEMNDQFWNYLNVLINENNNRKALFYIRQELGSSLGSEHNMDWAKKLYPTLNSILEKLEYKKINWDSKTENENDLYQKILSFIPQKLSSIII